MIPLFVNAADKKPDSKKKSAKIEQPYVKFDREYKGTVVEAYRLNVRVKPSTLYSTVASLRDGDTVTAVGRKGQWLQIKAPANTEVWLARQYVVNNKLTANVNLRGGPSVNHQKYGTAPRGMIVTIVDDKREDWIRIKPPENIFTWVSAAYINFTPEDIAAIEASVNSKKQSLIKNPVALDFVKGSSRNTRQKGMLVATQNNSTAIKFAICQKRNKRYKPVAYLIGKENELKKYTNKNITVTGRLRWVKGWSTPVIEVAGISAAK